MLRAVLLGLLSVSALAACKSKPESSASSQPGAVAGKVLEAKGSVSVKHGGATQPLTAGASVEADDTIITGPDSSVAIELAHNSARWELGPNKQQKVRESIAWNATKATAEESNQATAAAGRPAERSAAGTSATAKDIADEPAAAPAAPAAAAEMAPGAPAAPPRAAAPARRERGAAAPKAAPAPPPPPPAPEPEMDKADDEAEMPRRTRGAIMKKDAAPAADAVPAPGAAAPTSPVTAKAAPATGGGGGGKPPGEILGAKKSALQQCMKDHKDAVTLTVVGDGGAPAVTLKSKSAISAELDACMKNVVKSLAFGEGTFTISLRIEP